MRLASGLELAHRDGEWPALLCLHGIGGDAQSFAPQLQYFEGQRQIYSWNMPGYGGSKALPQCNFATLAEVVVQALDELQLAQVVLVGQSIGAMVAMEVAHRYPERVRAMVLIGTTPSFGGRDPSFAQAFLKARLAPLDEGKTMADLAPEFVPQIVGAHARADVIEAAVASMAAVPDAAYRGAIECLVTFNRRAELADMAMPVLLIAGDEDQNAPARTMEKMSHVLPDARYHCIGGAGHLINLEAAAACNQLIEDFLGELQ